MMKTMLFLKGAAIGLAVAIPVGPVGMVCIQRTLNKGRRVGFVSGLGACAADAVYGGVAGFGLSFVYHFILSQQLWFRLIGGLLLVYLGVRILLSPPPHPDSQVQNGTKSLFGAFSTTFLLTLTNPTTIFSFTAIFAAFGAGNLAGHPLAATILILGVFFGSSLWWLTLSGAVSFWRHKFDYRRLLFLNRFAAVIALFYALFILLSLFRT